MFFRPRRRRTFAELPRAEAVEVLYLCAVLACETGEPTDESVALRDVTAWLTGRDELEPLHRRQALSVTEETVTAQAVAAAEWVTLLEETAGMTSGRLGVILHVLAWWLGRQPLHESVIPPAQLVNQVLASR